MRVLAISITALTLTLLAMPLAPTAASAHARLVRATPADGAELAAVPVSIDLWFSEMLDVGFDSVTVFPAAQLQAAHREDHATGEPRVDGDDHTHLQRPVETLAPGDWVVEWRILSLDGHPARGRTTFRIRVGN